MSLFLLMGALPGASEVMQGVFGRMDTNGDGQLSAQEYAPFDERGSFEGMDLDHSGTVTLEEWSSYVRLTDPARNRPHPGVLSPVVASPAVVPTKKNQASSSRFFWIGGALLLMTGLGFWRWRRP
jgi:hypothetical protein